MARISYAFVQKKYRIKDREKSDLSHPRPHIVDGPIVPSTAQRKTREKKTTKGGELVSGAETGIRSASVRTSRNY